MWMIEDYIAIGVAGILLITAIIAAIFFLKNRKKMKRENSIKNEPDSELQRLSLSFRTATDNKVSFDGSHYNLDDPMIDAAASRKNLVENYIFEELQKATNNFSLNNLIEGSVYHGRLNGEDVAIKRVPTEIISRIEFHLSHQRITHHPNMIRLLGTSAMDGPDSFLVLEYASNGSLKDWIRGGLAIKSQFIASCNRFLNWNQRLKICLDAANALQFLHHTVNPCQVRLSMRNIFLDHDFNAKIGCLGLALSLEHKIEEGYLAPEYVRENTVSPSADVFAFGVVMLEVLSGRPPLEINGQKLSDEIKIVLRSENAEELRDWMDCTLGESYSFDGAVKVVNLARSCVEDDATARPSAGQIAAKLLNLVEELNIQTHMGNLFVKGGG
ncbi:hypothetical protein C2S53_004525 [Perilla frutescens var. hirtella]|uniref:Protein kinase domain-containing protein n=1 Tax=Perilla frutescens var. hirtella TaxID=608512 RepID=A0AAD4IYS7_PERFH|nr:hypothetical protein C2S53_004525 [Perilla frutescens var. hirtella]